MIPPGSPRVGAVLETSLYASDLDSAARFYEEVLGLEPFARAPGRHVFFRCGPGVFLLFDPVATAAPGGDVPIHGAHGAGHVAFAIPSAELPRWREALRAAGVSIEREVTWPGGGQSLYLRDPAGNSVELASPTIWSIPEEHVFNQSFTTENIDADS